jgi:alkanesulfonate monooxygenase SsuD/methylene tetrahydromethanopterin reductase-like flavin-dependent oxidoreductase (luciferase family)
MNVDLLLDAFGARWPDVRDAALAAADAGFGGLWAFDHVDGRVYGAADVLECWTLLSALAAVVPGVALGPMVLNIANRPAGVLAAMAATLQDVSGGRLLLGLGAGARPGTRYAREQEALGLPVYGDAQRRTHVARYVEDLRRTWAADGFLRPEPAPPLVLAAFGPKMAELAGRIGDGVNLRATDANLADLVAVARDAHAAAGRGGEPFVVTAFTELHDRWLPWDGPDRARLARLKVDRLVLFVSPPFSRERITAAGGRLDA